MSVGKATLNEVDLAINQDLKALLCHAELLPRAKQIAQDICSVNYGIMMQMKALIEKKNEVSFDEACKLEREGFKNFIGNAKLF